MSDPDVIPRLNELPEDEKAVLRERAETLPATLRQQMLDALEGKGYEDQPRLRRSDLPTTLCGWSDQPNVLYASKEDALAVDRDGKTGSSWMGEPTASQITYEEQPECDCPVCAPCQCKDCSSGVPYFLTHGCGIHYCQKKDQNQR